MIRNRPSRERASRLRWPRRFRAAAALALMGTAGLPAACAGGGDAPSRAREPQLRESWRWAAPSPSYAGMPAADDRHAALTFGQTWLVLLDGSGKELWQATSEDGLRDVAPLLTPDLVVVATEGGLAAFDRAGGSLRWEADVGERSNTPVRAGGALVTSTWDGSLLAVDAGGGGLLWQTRLAGAALGPPATDGQLVVVTWEADDGSSAGATAVDVASGARRWEVSLPPGGVGAPSVAGAGAGPSGRERGVVVAVAGDRAAHGLELDTGAARWRTELEGAGSPEVPPLALGNEVLVAHRLGGLALLDGADGAVRWAVSSDGAAVRGGPAGPGPGGWFALPLDDGRVLLAGPGRATLEVQPLGRVAGVAAGPDRLLLVSTRESDEDGMSASTGW